MTNKKNATGIVYILQFEFEDKKLIKIGVTQRNIEDRVAEILVSMFKKYREFYYCKPKRFRTTENAYQKEKELHDYFSEYRYKPDKKFSGSTEFFDIDLDIVVDKYDSMISIKKSTKKSKSSKFFKVNKNI